MWDRKKHGGEASRRAWSRGHRKGEDALTPSVKGIRRIPLALTSPPSPPVAHLDPSFALATMATTAPPPAYPDYDSLPSPSTSQPRPSRIPSPLLHLFSLFPLVTFPAPPSHESPPPTSPPATPQLYILPGHVRTDSQGHSRTTWTSRDVRCLTSQVEFLFRKVDFETRQLEREEAWGPRVGGLPFVHLPQPRLNRAGSSASTAAAGCSAAPPRLLAPDSIPTWVQTLAPFPYERVEATAGEAFDPYSNPAVKAEAAMWTTLLQKGVMAAVVSASLRETGGLKLKVKEFCADPSLDPISPFSFSRSYHARRLLPPPASPFSPLKSTRICSTNTWPRRAM